MDPSTDASWCVTFLAPSCLQRGNSEVRVLHWLPESDTGTEGGNSLLAAFPPPSHLHPSLAVCTGTSSWVKDLHPQEHPLRHLHRAESLQGQEVVLGVIWPQKYSWDVYVPVISTIIRLSRTFSFFHPCFLLANSGCLSLSLSGYFAQLDQRESWQETALSNWVFWEEFTKVWAGYKETTRASAEDSTLQTRGMGSFAALGLKG